ncbi:MAG: hypothetical protein AB8G96_08850 [Phycisphaerales bacterium]
MFRFTRARRVGAIAVAMSSFALAGIASAAPSTARSVAPQSCTAAGCTDAGHGHGHARGQRGEQARGACGERIFVAGHHTWVNERICVQRARVDRVWVDAVYRTRYDACGTPYRVCVREGYWKRVHIPARYESRPVRRWVAGQWTTCQRTGHHVHRGAQKGRRGYEQARRGRSSGSRSSSRGIDIRWDRLFR